MTDPTAEFEAIWAKPNHDNAKPSKTLYQVDRSLDLIQEKLVQMYTVLYNNGYVE